MAGMRLLVVEDEHRIANSIKKGLEQDKYAVDVAYTGTDGFDLAISEEYDLIILDLMLPGMDGIQICKKLRELNNHTPILMLTARGQIQDKVTGLDSGADDYLTKPFSFDELVARVRALTRRPKNSLGTVLTSGNIKLNTNEFKVTVSGAEVLLSSKEFALLEYLMRHQGKVLTKEQIINHVWDYDAEILPNTVEVNIRNLRKKIGQNAIKTQRGFGYVLQS